MLKPGWWIGGWAKHLLCKEQPVGSVGTPYSFEGLNFLVLWKVSLKRETRLNYVVLSAYTYMVSIKSPFFRLKKIRSLKIKEFLNDGLFSWHALRSQMVSKEHPILLMDKTFLWGFQQEPIFQIENNKVQRILALCAYWDNWVTKNSWKWDCSNLVNRQQKLPPYVLNCKKLRKWGLCYWKLSKRGTVLQSLLIPYARYHNPLLIRNRSWILTVHKDRIFWKNLLENKEMVL